MCHVILKGDFNDRTQVAVSFGSRFPMTKFELCLPLFVDKSCCAVTVFFTSNKKHPPGQIVGNFKSTKTQKSILQY